MITCTIFMGCVVRLWRSRGSADSSSHDDGDASEEPCAGERTDEAAEVGGAGPNRASRTPRGRSVRDASRSRRTCRTGTGRAPRRQAELEEHLVERLLRDVRAVDRREVAGRVVGKRAPRVGDEPGELARRQQPVPAGSERWVGRARRGPRRRGRSGAGSSWTRTRPWSSASLPNHLCRKPRSPWRRKRSGR